MEISTEKIVEMYAAGMTYDEISQATKLPLSTVRYKTINHPQHKWIARCNELATQVKLKYVDTQYEMGLKKKRDRLAERKTKGLCRDCGKKVKPYKNASGKGRKPTGYRCKACNAKRGAK